MTLDEMAERRRSATYAEDPAIGPRWRALANASARLAGLAVRGLGDLEPQAYQALLDSVRQQRERAEVALGEASADASTAIARREVGLVDVRAALPPRTAVVSFVRFERTGIVPQASGVTVEGPPRAWHGRRNIWRSSCGGPRGVRRDSARRRAVD